MSTFVALLDAEPIETRRALLAALRRTGAQEATCGAGADAAAAGGRGALRRLLRTAPDLVLVAASGPGCLAALAHRLLRPSSRLLVWQSGSSVRGWTPSGLAAGLADAVLLGGGASGQDVSVPAGAAGARRLDVPGPYDVAPFLHGPSARGEPGGEGGPVRIAVQGHLSLYGGGLDVLHELATLCERQPGLRIQLDWIGEGELRGVLEAQLLAPGLSHRFHGALADEAAASLYRRCDVLLAAHRREVRPAVLAGAMASGLLVLFDAGCPAARALVGPAGDGVDPGRPGALAATLGGLLARPAAELDALRAAGRARALATAPPAFERAVAGAVHHALEAHRARMLPRARLLPLAQALPRSRTPAQDRSLTQGQSIPQAQLPVQGASLPQASGLRQPAEAV